jgi:hypothetical protein
MADLVRFSPNRWSLALSYSPIESAAVRRAHIRVVGASCCDGGEW